MTPSEEDVAIKVDYEIVESFEARVAALRPGAPKELAKQLLQELQAASRSARLYEHLHGEQRNWRLGVEQAWRAARGTE
jgi:hypothetical protein